MAEPPAATNSGVAPRGAVEVAIALCLGGLAVSGYLTYEHFTAPTSLACPDTGIVNCVKVTTSTYAAVLDVPVALLGFCYFVVMTGLCLPASWRTRWPGARYARVGAATVGVIFVCYLLYVELFRLDAICLWCSAVHAITVLLFMTVAYAEAFRAVPAAADRNVQV